MAPDDVAILMAKMMAMEATWKEHEKSAQERYAHTAEHLSLMRKSQDMVVSKLEKMDDRLNSLPCDERQGVCKGIFNSISGQIKLLWGFLTIVLTAIIYQWGRK